MSHLIIKPFDSVFTPQGSKFEGTWHNLHEAVSGGIALDGSNIGRLFCPIVQAGFKPDFNAKISDAPSDLVAELGKNPISDWKVILADLRGNGNGVIPLHVAKSGYAIHQNKRNFDALIGAARQVLGDGNFEIATAGTLGAYSQFFVSIAIKGNDFTVGKGDQWESFFNLVSSHNALVASQIMLSVVRIVCMNTVQASISDADQAGTQSTIKHTANSVELITPQAFSTNLAAWIASRDTFKANMEAIKAQPLTLDGFRYFASGIFTSPESDQLSTNSFNRVEEMTAIFARDPDNGGDNRYGAVNAFTKYFTSGNGVGSAKVNAAKRIASANFGQVNHWKRKAIAVAVNEGESNGIETFADCVKRGEILYNDKVAADCAKARSN